LIGVLIARIARAARVAWRVLRAEGLRAVADRAADRLAEARRARSFLPAPPGWRPAAPVPILRVTATPPAPRLGGVQAQLLARLTAEARQDPPAPIALLYPEPSPDGSGWRLEVEAAGERRALRFPGGTPSPVDLEDPSFEAGVWAASDLIRARAVHVEGLAGLPFDSLRKLRQRELRLILSLHDFAAFCPRPHLLEHPPLRFCGYCRDLERCGRCLERSWPVDGAFQAARRESAAALLEEADALVFASDFLLRTHRDLFPGMPLERSRVIAPAVASVVTSVPAIPPRPPGPLRHVALVGGVQAHKGALVFAEVVRSLAGSGLRWTAYGGGDAALLTLLRGLPGVRVRGYYRQHALRRLLREDGVDLALLLSIVPESYSLALGECVRAGVPVLAFDLGALGDRVPDLGTGRLVPLEAGAEGIAAALRAMLLDGHAPAVPAGAAARIPDAVAAAAAYRALYREMGGL
jgi:glycosyltransferase involved in cell wall biosynthesis